MINYLKMLVLILTVLMIVGVQSTQAELMMEISDGVTTVTIVDQGTNDSLSALGGIGYTGVMGIFSVNVSSAFSIPLIGSPMAPQFALSSANISDSENGGTLTIMMTQTDIQPLGLLDVQSLVGGTTVGEMSFDTYFNKSNDPFAMETNTSSFGTYQNQAFSREQKSQISNDNPSSFTTVATLTHKAGKRVSSFGTHVTVAVAPEPVSTVLFITGGALFAARCYRKKNLILS